MEWFSRLKQPPTVQEKKITSEKLERATWAAIIEKGGFLYWMDYQLVQLKKITPEESQKYTTAFKAEREEGTTNHTGGIQ